MRCIRACPPSTLSTKKPRAPWQAGRRAWARLNGWHQDAGASPGHPDDPEAALLALSDIALVKRLTAQAELGAVKTARSGGKSWPEIGSLWALTLRACAIGGATRQTTRREDVGEARACCDGLTCTPERRTLHAWLAMAATTTARNMINVPTLMPPPQKKRAGSLPPDRRSTVRCAVEIPNSTNLPPRPTRVLAGRRVPPVQPAPRRGGR